MLDPILKFPRVIHERRDPTTGDDKTVGIIEGNMWINLDTGKVFLCVDALLGKWVAFLVTGQTVSGDDFVFGDGLTPVDAKFDLDGGNFIVDADNISITEDGNIWTDGYKIVLHRDVDIVDSGHITIRGKDEVNYTPEKYKDGTIHWNPAYNSFYGLHYDVDGGSFTYNAPFVTSVLSTRNPEPTDDFDSGYYLGQTWINLATQQKFTCFSCPPGGDAVWRLALSSAPTKAMVEYDDFIILYGGDDDTYMKISVNDFALYIKDAVGGFGVSTTGYGWVLDGSDNITVSEEDPITQGVFEEDGAGNLQPITGSQADTFFEFDINDDIQPKSA